jgi:aminoglycoside 3-N-acetyltransferase
VSTLLSEVVANAARARLARVRRGLRRHWARLDRVLDRRVLSMADFVRLLPTLGLTSGAVVLVHSAIEPLSRRVPGLRPLQLVQLLQEFLGEEGTLLMPTFPFRGRQRDYADQHDTFDVRKTPSQAGLVTEVFRRMPGVVRSLHPTHPIAGWGKHAVDLLATHHLGTAFGKNSPMYKLGERGGLVIGLGTRPRDTFTILHVPEELHPATRAWAYEERPRVMTIVDGARRIRYQMQVLRADPERERYEMGLLKTLLKERVATSVVAGGLPCSAARADRVIERALSLIERRSPSRFSGASGHRCDQRATEASTGLD